jgi:hypothetical protein
MLQAENHHATVRTGIADVRERWTKERCAAAFKVISSPNPPLMKRYSKTKKLPKTRQDFRRVYAKIKAESERVARGEAARLTWSM